MKSFVYNAVICFALLLCSRPAYANHVVEGDIRYTHVSDSTYKITIDIYYDCNALTTFSYPDIQRYRLITAIYDNTLFVDTVALMAHGTDSIGKQVTSPCTLGLLTQCNDINSAIPGLVRFTYTATYTLPHPSANWRFIYNGNTSYGSAGRSAALTNINYGDPNAVRLEAAVNSILNNSTPAITDTMPTYFCINSNSIFSPMASDPDGDSLTFLLISAADPVDIYSTNPSYYAVSYIPPYTATAPLAATSFSFDHATGTISFLPTHTQRALVAYSIEERRGGVLVGKSQREMTVLVENCSDPCVLATPVISKSSEASIYPNPANDRLTIDADGSRYTQVIITNIVGNVVLRQELNAHETILNTSQLATGIYYAALKGLAGYKVQKIVVMR